MRKYLKQYIRRMKQHDTELGKGWGQIVTPPWIDTPGGKQRVNCANTSVSSAHITHFVLCMKWVI